MIDALWIFYNRILTKTDELIHKLELGQEISNKEYNNLRDSYHSKLIEYLKAQNIILIKRQYIQL
ncbi:MAG: hypothetical protein ACTSXK_05105 [Promethearchaeota archaeon]